MTTFDIPHAGTLATALIGLSSVWVPDGAIALPPTPTPPQLPEAITPAPPQSLAWTLRAQGVQIYECRGSDGGAARWTFKAPEATLMDEDGRVIGSHGAGPYWLLHDGVRIEGRARSQVDGNRPGAIAWLLLDARATFAAAGAEHRLHGLQSIVRANTQGGLAPDSGCDSASLGQQARVPYTADYLLYVAPRARS